MLPPSEILSICAKTDTQSKNLVKANLSTRMRVVVVMESSDSVSEEVTLASNITFKELWRYFTTLKGQRIKCWELIYT